MYRNKLWIILVIYASCSTSIIFGQTRDDVLILKKELSQHNTDTDSISNVYFEKLKRIGIDSTANFKVRQDALILIGEIQTDESISFLIDHIALYIFNGPYDGDATDYLEHPCYYALLKGRDSWWNYYAIPHVLKSLSKNEKNEDEIIWIAKIFKVAFRSKKNLPSAFIKNIMRTAHPPLRENLQKILTIAEKW